MKLIRLYREFMAWREAKRIKRVAFWPLLSLELADATREECILAAFRASIPHEYKGLLAQQLLMRSCRNNRPGAPTISDAVGLVEKRIAGIDSERV